MNPDTFDLPEAAWDRIAQILPSEPRRPQGGRPPLDSYRVLLGVLYRLSTGCQWRALPSRFGPGSTVHRRFQAWVRDGTFEKIFEVLLLFYDEIQGIDWKWMSADGASVKAPKGGTQTGPNPTDRAKCGTKRHIIVDGRGVPLGVEVSGANRHDSRMLEPTLEAVPESIRPKEKDCPIHLCLDKAYDSASVVQEVKAHKIIPHIRKRGEAPMTGCRYGKPRRWVVERTNSWHNRFRALVVRWERKGENYRALVLLASALIAIRVGSGGA